MTDYNYRLEKINSEIGELYGYDAVRECQLQDPVQTEIIYHRFVSRSKGIRRTKKCPQGYRRKRRTWKEVRLIKRKGEIYKFTQWHRFQFDQEATEIGVKDGEEFKEKIDIVWGY
jgi:hypothetical protein